MEQGVLVKLAPGQLLLPDRDRGQGLVAAGREPGRFGGQPGLARAEAAQAEGGAQGRGAGLAGEIAARFVGEQGRAMAGSGGAAIGKGL